MTAELAHAPLRTAPAPVSSWSRVYGFGSVYAKTLRDSRLAVIIMAGILGSINLASGASYGRTYTTLQSRIDFAKLVYELPAAMRGVYGNPSPANLQTLGGMISLKNAASVAVVAGFWSIFALSSTLAGEARSGSLEFVSVTPLGSRRIAIEKLAAHLTGMAVVLIVLAGASLLAGAAFGSLPGDAISPEAAIGFSLWTGLMALASGSVAFALAPVIGRAGAAGIAGAVLIGGDFVNGYSASVPQLAGWGNITWFGWTSQNQPLAGQFDWPSLIPVALVAMVLFAVGVELFARRDLGETSAIPWPGLPAATLGLRGPVSRSFGERLPLALAWGAGIGLFGMALAATAASFSNLVHVSPTSVNLFHRLFPNIDLATSGGFLQLAFVELGFVLVGFAASTLVAGWASDESSGRLEMLLSAPLGRARWAMSSGLGVFAAIAVMTALLAIGVGAGAAMVGSDASTPMLGTVVLGLYAAALAGIGMAVGGLLRPSIAGEAVAAVVIATFLIDLIAPALKLPDWVHGLALTAHMGEPMTGMWDWAGIAACVILALAGLALAGVGMSRRDVAA